MSHLQDRPASGLVTAANLQAGVLLLTAAAQTFHDLEENTLSVVDLLIFNPTAGAIICTVNVMGIAIIISVPAVTTTRVLDQAALRGSNVVGANNLITALGNLCIAWGTVSVG